jgi:hypothetical protein
MEWHAILEAVGEEGFFKEIVGYELGCVHQYCPNLLSAEQARGTYGIRQ